VRSRLIDLGTEIFPRERQTPEALGAMQKAEIEKWWPIIKAARMIEDMTVRKFTLKTQSDYIRVVKNFTIFLGRSPDTASNEDLRRFQLHLNEKRVGAPTRCSALHFPTDFVRPFLRENPHFAGVFSRQPQPRPTTLANQLNLFST
jgi:hypothetical protein